MLEFRDAVGQMQESALPDFPVQGPRTTLWVCRFLVENGGSPMARHSRWRSEGQLLASEGGVGEHERCCRLLEQMACWDQLNLPDLASAELVARSLQMQEERHRDRLLSAEDGDSHLFYGTSAVRGNLCVCPALQAHVSAELAKEVAVAKERRKAREERVAARAPRAKAKGGNGKGDAGGGAA